MAPLVLAAAAALAASAVWAAPRSPGVASPCGLGLPPPEFGEPAFEVPDGGSVREERLEGGALECILRRADGTRFARAYRDTAGQVIEVAFYRESGQLREDEDAAMAAPGSGSATTRSAEVTCGSSHTASLGSKYWRKSFVWRIGHTVSGIAAGKAVNAVRYAEGEWLNNVNWCGIKDEASIPARYDGRSSAGYRHDGKNVIDWGSMADDQDCSLSLACTQTWYGTDGAPIESDIRFNTKYPWAAGARAGRYDIQSAAVHEFGHVFQLDHVTSSANKGYTLVMWPYIGPDNVSAHKLGRGDAIADNKNY